MNNFELHEKAQELADQYTAYQLARMLLKCVEKCENKEGGDV